MTAWFRRQIPQTQPGHAPLDASLVEAKLASFIASKSKLIEASGIASDTKIFSSGLLDSLAFIEIVLFVEKEFQIRLGKVTEVNMTSLDTVGQIVDAVLKAMGADEPAH